MFSSTTAIIADHHEFYRHAYQNLFTNHFGIKVSSTVSNSAQLHQTLKQPPAPQYLLMDAQLPGENMASLCRQILLAHPAINIVIVVANCGYWLVEQLMQSGVRGIIPKGSSIERLAQCLQNVGNGQIDFWITCLPGPIPSTNGNQALKFNCQEITLIEKLFEEKDSNQIADEMFLSPATIENRRKTLRAKLGVKNVVGIIKYALINSIVWLGWRKES